MRLYPLPDRIALMKESESKNTGEDVGGKGFLYALIGNLIIANIDYEWDTKK